MPKDQRHITTTALEAKAAAQCAIQRRPQRVRAARTSARLTLMLHHLRTPLRRKHALAYHHA
eukprot:4248555-Pyramimonas_sp.AAC.1